MLYITGDTHGETGRFLQPGLRTLLTPSDSLIVAGDFGFLFGRGNADQEKLDCLASLPFTLLFVDGNHECFPELSSCPEELWCGGRIHRLRPNVIHLMRGQVFTIEGLRIFTMGGGYSIDKAFRAPGRSWWPEELPCEEEYREALDNLRRCANTVDVIISHAAPDETMEALMQSGVIPGRYPEELRLGLFLEQVRRLVRHEHYYFGHLHLDRCLFRGQIALYQDIRRLDTGEKVDLAESE